MLSFAFLAASFHKVCQSGKELLHVLLTSDILRVFSREDVLRHTALLDNVAAKQIGVIGGTALNPSVDKGTKRVQLRVSGFTDTETASL